MPEDTAPGLPRTTGTGRDEKAAGPAGQRKNGLRPGVSDALTAAMRTGWADTGRRDVAPLAQAARTSERRAAVSARFPGERLVVPAGRLRPRSGDTAYPFRAASDYAYLTGDRFTALLGRLYLDHFHDTSLVAAAGDGGLARTLYERSAPPGDTTAAPSSGRSPHRRTPAPSPSTPRWASTARPPCPTTTARGSTASSSPAASEAATVRRGPGGPAGREGLRSGA